MSTTSSDIMAYSLLILFLIWMGLAAWLRYRILPGVRAGLPSPKRPIDAGGSPGLIREQPRTPGAISTDEHIDLRRLRLATTGHDKAATDGDGAKPSSSSCSLYMEAVSELYALDV